LFLLLFGAGAELAQEQPNQTGVSSAIDGAFRACLRLENGRIIEKLAMSSSDSFCLN